MSGSSCSRGQRMVNLVRESSNSKVELDKKKTTKYTELKPVTFTEPPKTDNFLIQYDTDNFHLSKDHNNETYEFPTFISTDQQPPVSIDNYQLSPEDYQSPEIIREDIEQACSSINNDDSSPAALAGPSTLDNYDDIDPIDYNSDDSVKDPDFTVNERDVPDSSDSDIPVAMLKKNIPNIQRNRTSDEYTKKGGVRKRKRFEQSLAERKKRKAQERIDKHAVKPSCKITCKKQCNSSFTIDQQKAINNQYWQMTFTERRNFVLSAVISNDAKRHRVLENSKRKKTLQYFLKNESGDRVQVCKTFFLSTLGYTKNNDRIIQDCFPAGSSNTTICHINSRQGKHSKTPKIDRNLIRSHVESFQPAVSHYRREHAPNKRYLPSDITINMMYFDFKQKHKITCSYEVYRSVVTKEMNISFTKLGNEQCETCESFSLHNPEHTKENPGVGCDECVSWNTHINKADEARKAYRHDAEIPDQNTSYFSGDLQKVIMLPRLDMFKKAIFCRRIIAFNQSFVPLGTKQKHLLPNAALWHEALAGRQKEDMVSVYYHFFLEMRDCEKIVVWVDNCASQNKNWTLLSFLIYMVNSSESVTKEICLKYFEPGHTFMSADNFHHQVELAMQRDPKIYDFRDFVNVVAKANNKKVNVLTPHDFFEWEDCSSLYKLKKLQPRIYLKDIVQIRAKRGANTLTYKTSFSGDELELNFLKNENMKNGVRFPSNKKPMRGITEERKNTVIQNLSSLMPEHRLQFWKNLPINDAAADLVNVIDE